MKTRALALCLTVLMVFSMAACKKEKKGDSPAQTTPADSTSVIAQSRIEGSYEQWLAAACVQVTAILMYPECEIQGVYALSETPYEKKMDSKGVVIHILNEGRDIWIASAPLAQERTESGTRDLKAAGIGFNTYDEVEQASLPDITPLSLESLETYIEQTLLPSIYER